MPDTYQRISDLIVHLQRPIWFERFEQNNLPNWSSPIENLPNPIQISRRRTMLTALLIEFRIIGLPLSVCVLITPDDNEFAEIKVRHFFQRRLTVFFRRNSPKEIFLIWIVSKVSLGWVVASLRILESREARLFTEDCSLKILTRNYGSERN